MTIQTFKDFRNARLTCKSQGATLSDVEQCMIQPRAEMAKVLGQNPATSGLFQCDPQIKHRTNYVDDLAALAKNGSFDVSQIVTGEPLVTENGILCHGGNEGETSIDLITLADNSSYLVKSGGSFSDTTSDIVAYAEVMQIANVLGEDIPAMVWSNPIHGRLAMTEMRSQDLRTTPPWEDFNPHELLTSLVFESLISDSDRNPSNIMEIAPGALGHIDFGGAFVGVQLAGEPRSELAQNFENAIRRSGSPQGNGIEDIEAGNPGYTQALEEVYIKWRTQWRPTLVDMGPKFRENRKTRKLAAPSTVPASDPTLLLTMENINLTERYLERLVTHAGLNLQSLRNQASREAINAELENFETAQSVEFREPSSGQGSPVCEEVTSDIRVARMDLDLIIRNESCSQQSLQKLSEHLDRIYLDSEDMNPEDCPVVFENILEAFRDLDGWDQRCRSGQASTPFDDITALQAVLTDMTEEVGLGEEDRTCDALPAIDRKIGEMDTAWRLMVDRGQGPGSLGKNMDITRGFTSLRKVMKEARIRCNA